MKKDLFKLFLLSVFSIVIFSCSKKDDEKPINISFENSSYTLPKDGSIDVKLKANPALKDALTIPFTLSGTAESGKDFEISGSSFQFSAGSNEAKVTIKPLTTYKKDKKITLTLDKLQDSKYIISASSVNISVVPQDEIIYSFVSRKYALTSSLDVELSLLNQDGSKYDAPQDLTFDVELDTKESTAVEGVNFSFDNGKTITVKKGKSKGNIKLKIIKKEADKDIIVLKLKDRDGLVAGNYDRSKVSIMGSIINDIMETWVFKELHNLSWFKDSFYADISKAPVCSDKDTIIFNNEGNFINKMTGGLKAYFPGNSEFTDKGERDEIIQEDIAGGNIPRHNIAVLSMTNINVNFDLNKSNIREALVGFAIIDVDGESVLEMTIYDYEPTAFLSDVYEWMKGGANPGETDMQTAPVRVYFSKAK